MGTRKSASDRASRDLWAEQIAALAAEGATKSRKAPITVDRVVDAALSIVEADGFDALTMRGVIAALLAGPGSVYAQVRDKAELDDRMIGVLCSRVTVPVPNPARWKEQALDVCRQLRDQYLRYPGISRAAMDAAPHNLEALRLTEGLLAILTSGGASVQAAAWVSDAAFQYVGSYSIVSRRRGPQGDTHGVVVDRDELIARLRMLPPDLFPIIAKHAPEVTSSEGHERFEFTLGLLLGGLGSTTS